MRDAPTWSAEQGELSDRMDHIGDWTYENTIERMRTGLDFDEERRHLRQFAHKEELLAYEQVAFAIGAGRPGPVEPGGRSPAGHQEAAGAEPDG
ncbi:hypothetical protein [Agromyces sp. ZXT2-3]|uniref:hypothetical protein n=1 Tax=Agromyces sp. ZXT2-3 TaxID=3461152 RepID=UPI004054D7F5